METPKARTSRAPETLHPHSTDACVNPSERGAAEDAAYHRREAIRLTERAKRTKDQHRASALLARAEMHRMSATMADWGAPQFVIDNPPAMIVGWPAPDGEP